MNKQAKRADDSCDVGPCRAAVVANTQRRLGDQPVGIAVTRDVSAGRRTAGIGELAGRCPTLRDDGFER